MTRIDKETDEEVQSLLENLDLNCVFHENESLPLAKDLIDQDALEPIDETEPDDDGIGQEVLNSKLKTSGPETSSTANPKEKRPSSAAVL